MGAGTSRVVLTSNCGVQIRCLDGDSEGAPQELEGSDIDEAMFVREFPNDSGDIFDPMTIWDGFAGRFWVVASEWHIIDDPEDPNNGKIEGRLHVVCSTSAAPRDVSTAYWNKYTAGGAAPPFNPHASGFSDALVIDALADRPRIAVDKANLYICVREGNNDGNQYNDRDLMIVIPKGPIVDNDDQTAPAVEEMKFIDVTVNNGTHGITWGHALAVDYDIEDGGTPKVYTIALPDLTADNQTTDYTTIRFGAFYWDGDSWEYQSTLLTMPSGKNFRGVVRTIPGGPGDTNSIDPGIFWNACTRRIGGTRKVWAVHHVRTYGSSDEHCFVQWYKIQPNNYPSGTPALQTVQRIQNASYYYHDPGIGANSNGDVVVQFNRSGPSGNGGYPRVYRKIIPASCQAEAPTLVKSGPNTAYTQNSAWIDFCAVVPDAVTTGDFWGHSMIVHDSDQFQTIVAKYTVSCPGGRGGDFDGDGEVTAGDVAEFAALAARASDSADLDGNGAVDVMDLLAMLRAVDETEPED